MNKFWRLAAVQLLLTSLPINFRSVEKVYLLLVYIHHKGFEPLSPASEAGILSIVLVIHRL